MKVQASKEGVSIFFAGQTVSNATACPLAVFYEVVTG